MTKKLLDVEENVPGLVNKTWAHTGADGQKQITVETEQDVQPILDRNKQAYTHAPQGYAGSDVHEVADVPNNVVMDLFQKQQATVGMTFDEFLGLKTDRSQKFWRGVLNDPDYLYLRTRPGRVDPKRNAWL